MKTAVSFLALALAACDVSSSSTSTPAESPPPVQVYEAVPKPCFFDMELCPTTFPGSLEVEHCTIPYACPVVDVSEPDGIVCVRFMIEDCFADWPEKLCTDK